MTDFLLELRSEEIPARMQAKARDDLARLFAAEIAKAGLTAAETVTYATPRRLALIARGLPDATEAVAEEVKGPKTAAPPQALEGFLRKTGLAREQLVERDGVFFAVTERPGRATAAVLAEAIPAIVRAFPWPKSMRWGAASTSTESPRWVRPLQSIVALFGDEVVPFEIAGLASGAATLGHRFHHPGVITIGGAHDYVEKLRACHVIVDQDERATLIRERAGALAVGAGLVLVDDEGLVAENAGLTEWPVPLLGRFDDAFLAVPPEVIQLTARVNQKYFVCRDGAGRLANAFVCTSNIEATDGGAKIVEGNRKVLAARLADARFFYDTDLKVPLAEQAKKLDRIVFHEKLGTVADKAERIKQLAAETLPEHLGWPEERARALKPDIIAEAATFSRADLVTSMVGEFPELQGVMGGYYAREEKLLSANAIADFYKPVGASDDLPRDDVGLVLALADRADSLYGFFGHNLRPTGSRDPFALRRAGLSLIRLIIESEARISLSRLMSDVDFAWQLSDRGVDWSDPKDAIVTFLIDRLKVQQREAGVRHDLIDAVFALGGEDDLVRLLARVRALQAFVGTEDGANLLAGYKRAANILKKEGWQAPSPLVGEGRGPLAPASGKDEGDGVHLTPPRPSAPAALPPSPTRGEGILLSYTPELAEGALIAALDVAAPAAAAAVAHEAFEAAMAALATLRAPIDAFFDSVTVNDPDPAKRSARLALLARVRDAVHEVADFSKIEG